MFAFVLACWILILVFAVGGIRVVVDIAVVVFVLCFVCFVMIVAVV